MDIFSNTKSVHIKLKKDTHTLLRQELFKMNLSMQEVVEEFCSQFIAGHPSLRRIIDDYLTKKAKIEISDIEKNLKEKVLIVKKSIPAQGQDVLYRLIDEESPFKTRGKNDNEDD